MWTGLCSPRGSLPLMSSSPAFLEHDRVFWEKFHEREEQASDSWAQGSATAGNEVMVHCQNFPKSVDVIKDLLEKTITPYLVKVMAQHQMVIEPSSVKWVNQSNVFSWKVVVENTDVANILCTKVVSLEVRMQDGTGCITFKSGFHMMVIAITTSASSSGPSTASPPPSSVPTAPQPTPSTTSSGWEDVGAQLHVSASQ